MNNGDREGERAAETLCGLVPCCHTRGLRTTAAVKLPVTKSGKISLKSSQH